MHIINLKISLPQICWVVSSTWGFLDRARWNDFAGLIEPEGGAFSPAHNRASVSEHSILHSRISKFGLWLIFQCSHQNDRCSLMGFFTFTRLDLFSFCVFVDVIQLESSLVQKAM